MVKTVSRQIARPRTLAERLFPSCSCVGKPRDAQRRNFFAAFFAPRGRRFSVLCHFVCRVINSLTRMRGMPFHECTYSRKVGSGGDGPASGGSSNGRSAPGTSGISKTIVPKSRVSIDGAQPTKKTMAVTQRNTVPNVIRASAILINSNKHAINTSTNPLAVPCPALSC